MRVLSTALQSIILASSVVLTVALSNDSGTAIGSALAVAASPTALGTATSAFAADESVSAEDVEKGFVSDESN